MERFKWLPSAAVGADRTGLRHHLRPDGNFNCDVAYHAMEIASNAFWIDLVLASSAKRGDLAYRLAAVSIVSIFVGPEEGAGRRREAHTTTSATRCQTARVRVSLVAPLDQRRVVTARAMRHVTAPSERSLQEALLFFLDARFDGSKRRAA